MPAPASPFGLLRAAPSVYIVARTNGLGQVTSRSATIATKSAVELCVMQILPGCVLAIQSGSDGWVDLSSGSCTTNNHVDGQCAGEQIVVHL